MGWGDVPTKWTQEAPSVDILISDKVEQIKTNQKRRKEQC